MIDTDYTRPLFFAPRRTDLLLRTDSERLEQFLGHSPDRSSLPAHVVWKVNKVRISPTLLQNYKQAVAVSCCVEHIVSEIWTFTRKGQLLLGVKGLDTTSFVKIDEDNQCRSVLLSGAESLSGKRAKRPVVDV